LRDVLSEKDEKLLINSLVAKLLFLEEILGKYFQLLREGIKLEPSMHAY
jgi:hypothetical protein